MSEPEPESELPAELTTSAERLVFFTDAVAAIAITLLILPLLDVVTEVSGKHETLGELVRGHIEEFGAFALSFAVIFRFWWGHHGLFRHVATTSPTLVRWSAVWTFAIVLLPIPTAIITAYPPSAGTVGMYGGTLVLASGALAMLAQVVHRHPELSGDRPPASREDVLGTTTVFAALLLATVIGAAFADTVNFWALLLMFLTDPVDRLVKSRWRR